MRTGHLFAGAGGGLLGDLILGHKPVFAVEQDKRCCATLRYRADEWFPGLHVHEGDIRLFNPSDWKSRVDCIHAGFPCQDISAAGTGRGIDGERSGLVKEVFRSIDVIQPKFVFLENSPRIRTKGRDSVITALVARGYAWSDGILGAADVGAGHNRDRWWLLVANADGLRELQNANADCQGRTNSSRITANARQKIDIWRSAAVEYDKTSTARAPAWFEIEPNVGRLVYGLANDVVPGAVKALGNGQGPLQAATAYVLLGGQLGV